MAREQSVPRRSSSVQLSSQDPRRLRAADQHRLVPPDLQRDDQVQIPTARLDLVPLTVADATDLFASSEFAKQSFGPEVVEHYTHFFRTECEAYARAVTDWERKRYFERI